MDSEVFRCALRELVPESQKWKPRVYTLRATGQLEIRESSAGPVKLALDLQHLAFAERSALGADVVAIYTPERVLYVRSEAGRPEDRAAAAEALCEAVRSVTGAWVAPPLCGQLVKRGRIVRSFKTRYFVAFGGMLRCECSRLRPGRGVRHG